VAQVDSPAQACCWALEAAEPRLIKIAYLRTELKPGQADSDSDSPATPH
jgi:hypothetical protein